MKKLSSQRPKTLTPFPPLRLSVPYRAEGLVTHDDVRKWRSGGQAPIRDDELLASIAYRLSQAIEKFHEEYVKELRWSPFMGQFGGSAKLGSGSG
jgi:hypothetical protein